MQTLLKLLFYLLSSVFYLFATPIQYAPIIVGDIVTFVPYSHINITLGNDRLLDRSIDNILTVNINHPNDIVKYEWREGNKLLGIDSTFSTKNLSSGVHNITLTVIDNNGLTTSDKIIIVLKSSEYVGKTIKATLGTDNYLKYIRVANYLENLNWNEIPSGGIGISEKSYIDTEGKEEVLTRSYSNYKFGNAIVNGTMTLTFNTLPAPNKTLKNVSTNLIFSTYDNNITIKTIAHRTTNNNQSMHDFLIDKYYIYDEKYNEHIDIIGFDSQHPRLYLGSEGYVDIDTNSENFKAFGRNNTELSLVFKPEEAIYETKELEIVEPGEEPSFYQSRIYSPKRGQGIIESMLNGISQDNLYFLPYQVSYFEPIKFYENNGTPQLLEYAFYSWHINYKLLNYDKSDIDISIEWFVNDVKVDTPFMNELPLNSYSENDMVKVIIHTQYGDILTKTQQLLSAEENNYRNSSGKYEYPDDTYDIEYRTNDSTFDLNLLKHEYFDTIDMEHSDFSWTVFHGFNPELENYSIIPSTQYRKVPSVTYLNSLYGYTGAVYLKIYTNDEIKVVRFNITLAQGNEGYVGNLPNIIESIDEANITNNSKYLATHKVWNFDIDSNGFSDIIYISETYSGFFLNVSYQNTKRVFEFEKMAINGSVYVGDFDGDRTKEALIFSSDVNETKIINLDKGNIHKLKDVHLSSYHNLLDIKSVADMNNDGRDDLIIANNQEDKLYIYDDINNTLSKRLIGDNVCMEIVSIKDINSDGLKDIICSPKNKLNYLYTKNSEDFFSSDLIIKYYLQNSDNSFTIKLRKYSLINNVNYQQASQVWVYGSVMLGNENIAVSLRDKNGYMLYTCDLNSDSIEPKGKTPTNTSAIETFFTPKDINHDGLSDLIAYQDYDQLNIFHQKQDFIFESDYSIGLSSSYPLTNRLLENAFLDDIDDDGSLEIVTVNGENKFSYINFK